MNWETGEQTETDVLNAIMTLTDYCRRHLSDGLKCSDECVFRNPQCPFLVPMNPPIKWKMPDKILMSIGESNE